MAKGHKKIVGSYCYKGNGCTSRFCEFCSNGDKYEEIVCEENENEYENLEDEVAQMDKQHKLLDSIVDKYRNPMTETAEYALQMRKLVNLYEKEIGNKTKDIEVLDTCLELIDVFIKTYCCRNGGCEKCPLVHYTEPDHFTACDFDDFVVSIIDLEKKILKGEKND